MGIIKKKTMEILSAAWLIPITKPVIDNGSLVVGDGRILDIGNRLDILKKYRGLEERRFESVLMPGLINGHMHLELSHISDIKSPSPNSPFTDWITELLIKREKETLNRAQIIGAFTAVLLRQYASGVALIADIGNTFLPELSDRRTEGWPEIHRMIEFIAPNRKAVNEAVEKINALPERYPVCVHAPYSTGADLFLNVKKRCRKLGHIFSVHTAETAPELEFLRSGTGCFRDFLKKRKSWDDAFTFTKEGFAGTVFYYDHLGILDGKTLLVHAVHVSQEELRLVAARGSRICLCPGSNLFLHVGKAPVEKMLAAGLLPALGTDSPASNQDLDLWREMQLLAAGHPGVALDSILAMATLGGAQALHRAEDYGSLTPGARSHILHVSSAALSRCSDSRQIVDELVTGGRPSEISWISTRH